MKKILLTGAHGFIGSKLLQHLLNNTTNVVVALTRNHLSFSHSRLHSVITDLTAENSLRHLPMQIDTILHLAQSRYYRDPYPHIDDMVAVNIRATANLLEWARQNGVKQFILTSTGNVYSPCSERLTEEHVCIPNSIYAATKLGAEMLVNQYSSYFSTVILRLFGVYGPGQRGMLIANILERIINEQEIILASEAGIYMTPLYIEDLLQLISQLLPLTLTMNQWLFNVSGPEAVSLRDICIIAEQIIGKKARIRYTSELPRYLLGQASKLTNLIDFQKFTPLTVGLSATIRDYSYAT